MKKSCYLGTPTSQKNVWVQNDLLTGEKRFYYFDPANNSTEFLNGTMKGMIPRENLPLETRGRWIVDQKNNRVELKCVNWYGVHMPK